MAHLSLALPMAILTMPIVVLVVLRIAASIADRRTAERSKRLLAAIAPVEIERAREVQAKQPEPSTTSVSVLTEEAERDQG